MSAPLLDFARFVLTRFPGVPRQDETLLYVQVFGAVLTSALCAAGAMAFFFLSLHALAVSAPNALLVALCVAFSTLLFPYSGYFFSEPFTTLLLLAAVFEIARNSTLAPRSAVTAGMLLAFSIWIRPTMVLATPLFVAAVMLRERLAALRCVVLLSVFPVLAGIGYLLWNKVLFGRAFEFGYPNVAEMGKQLNSFHTRFYVGLQGLLISPGKSIFIFFPALLLAIPSIPRLWRRDRAIAMLAVGLPLTYLLFYMRYTQWEGGLCPGPRYLLPFLCVTCLSLGPVLENGSRSSRAWLLLLAAGGFAVQTITYATSFLEDQAIGAYYDYHFDYRMSYDPLVSQTQRLFAYLNGKPAGLGLGFDRWFVFLHKLGVSASTEVLFAGVLLMLAVLAAFQLRRTLKQSESAKRTVPLAQPA
jgi:hypothetical protein